MSEILPVWSDLNVENLEPGASYRWYVYGDPDDEVLRVAILVQDWNDILFNLDTDLRDTLSEVNLDTDGYPVEGMIKMVCEHFENRFARLYPIRQRYSVVFAYLVNKRLISTSNGTAAELQRTLIATALFHHQIYPSVLFAGQKIEPSTEIVVSLRRVVDRLRSSTRAPDAKIAFTPKQFGPVYRFLETVSFEDVDFPKGSPTDHWFTVAFELVRALMLARHERDPAIEPVYTAGQMKRLFAPLQPIFERREITKEAREALTTYLLDLLLEVADLYEKRLDYTAGCIRI